MLVSEILAYSRQKFESQLGRAGIVRNKKPRKRYKQFHSLLCRLVGYFFVLKSANAQLLVFFLLIVFISFVCV